jgi:uncharacterized SAM-binding protein YcdF (DUF218 family)
VKSARPPRTRRRFGRAALVLLVALLIGAAWAFPRTGRYFVVDTVTGPADAIVVLAGTRAERWLEGVDLYKEKLAPRIVLSSGRIEVAESRLRERGIRFPREVDLIRDAMIQLGVPADAIEPFSDSVDNTAAEAAVTRTIVASHGWRRIIVVTSKYHTRRSLFAFEREFKGSGVTIEIRGTRHEVSAPDEWWKHRPDIRFVVSEVIKLTLYRLGLAE